MSGIEGVTPPAADELLVVVGPTASGKTELAIRLCEQLDAEVIGADSVQIYRCFDIGSGKPDERERRRARHHLVDQIDPLAPMDAARFVALAEAAISDVRSRGRTPIVCGGSFLWVKALLHGLAPAPPADPTLRARHQVLAEAEGRGALHALLAAVDPAAARRLAPNDLVRVSRALEIHALTGRTESEWHAEHGFRTVRHRARLLGVARERAELDRRIRARTDRWLAAGWVAEVRALLSRGYERARPMGSVGYRQIRDHLRGDLPAARLGDAIVHATRRFVRQQRTWLRDQPVSWIEPPA